MRNYFAVLMVVISLMLASRVSAQTRPDAAYSGTITQTRRLSGTSGKVTFQDIAGVFGGGSSSSLRQRSSGELVFRCLGCKSETRQLLPSDGGTSHVILNLKALKSARLGQTPNRTYFVEVTYRDGTSETFLSIDGLQAVDVFLDGGAGIRVEVGPLDYDTVIELDDVTPPSAP